MKKISVLIVATFLVLKICSQSYEINFVGTGDTTIVDNVYIMNLTQGTFLAIKGDDILKLNCITDINSIQSEINSLGVYPNPTTEYTEIQFTTINATNVLVAVYDVSGKLVVQSNKFLPPGIHKYKISSLNPGLYSILVNEQNRCLKAKLISQGTLDNEAKIEYVSSNDLKMNQNRVLQLKSSSSIKNMDYAEGDILKLTAVTNEYSASETFTPSESKTISFNLKACKDKDGNKYEIVMIGSQLWMAENLKTTKYRNGDEIGTSNPILLNIGSEYNPKYQWAYDGNDNYIMENGRLYTWYAATDSRNVCPVGWHIPTYLEFNDLIFYLINNGYGLEGSGDDVASSLASNSNWMITAYYAPGTPGNDLLSNNSSGFNAFPSGCRNYYGEFNNIGVYSFIWSSTEDLHSPSAKCLHLMFNAYSAMNIFINKLQGLSVRCVKD